MRRWWPVGVIVFVALVLLASFQAAFQHAAPSGSGSDAAQRGPAAHWTFSARLGDRVIDSAGGHDGIVRHPIWMTSEKYFSFSVILRLDGERTYMEVPSAEELPFDGAFTLAAWVKSDSHRDRQILVYKADPGGNFRAAPVTFYVPWGQGRLGLVLSDGQKRVGFLSDGTIRTGQWHHVALTYDDRTGEIRYYIDGEPAGEDTTSWRPRDHPGPLYIGMGRAREEAFFPFRGELESLMVYERALAPQEIQRLYRRETLP